MSIDQMTSRNLLNVLLLEDLSTGALDPTLGLRFRVCMPSFFMANGLLT